MMRCRPGLRLVMVALLLSRYAAATDQGASIFALTPGRDGRAEVHLEVRNAALRNDLLSGLGAGRFRVLTRAGQARIDRAERLPVDVEGIHTVLAFDQSASFRPHLNDALALAQKFLAASPARGSFTVLSFGTSLGTPSDAPSAAEAQRLLAGVARSKPEFQTRLKASIREAAAVASQHLPMPRGARQVVVFSDAGEESSVYTSEQVIADARARGVRINVVVLGAGKGATLAQRRDDMKRLAEETGGQSVEVHERNAAATAVEAMARASEGLVRLSVSFCDVPPAPALRDEQLQVEVLQAGRVAASTNWVSFSQQAGGAASRSCEGCPPGGSCAPPPAAAPSASAPPAPPPPAPPPAPAPPWKLLVGLAGAALLAVILAVLLRGRRRPEPAPVAAPPPPTPLPPPAVPTTAAIDPQAAQQVARPRPDSMRPTDLWLVVVRSPSGSGRDLRVSTKPLSIGAGPGNDLRLDVGEISSRHALIERTPQGQVFLTDRGSTNGTFVDGVRLERGQRVALRPGQIIGLSTRVEVRLEQR